MSDRYVIQWKSKVNGRAGRGSKVFGREEADQLVAELNTEYPDIEHEAIAIEELPTQPPESDQSLEEPASTEPGAVAPPAEHEHATSRQ